MMADPARLRAIDVDLAANTLCLRFNDAAPAREVVEDVPAIIDIGAGGRLIGIELAAGYVDVMPPEPGTEHLTRSAETEVAVAREQGSGALASVTVPRRGAGYEITYPSGNQ
jgi:hypothetical protein